MLKIKETVPSSGLSEQILSEAPRLTESTRFTFHCGNQLPCFNRCCANVNIVLTPIDVARLKNNLGINSGEFLRRYSIIPFAREHQFPLVFLKMREDQSKTCPFVGPGGCTVYKDRPWACRMYPIGVASPAEEEEDGRFFFLIQEEFCQGHSQQDSWTIAEWIEDQGAEEYDQLGEEFKAITLNQAFLEKERSLDPAQMDMLFMALYDLDKFRNFVFETSFLKKFRLNRTLINSAKMNDLDLLRIGFRWIRFCIFGEATLEIREHIQKKTLRRMSSPKSRLRS